MSKKVSIGAAISVAAIAAAVTVTLTYTYAMNRFNSKVADVNERQAMYNKLSEIDQTTRQNYVGQINEKAVTDGICAGYLAGIGDPHTTYLSAKKYKAYRASAESTDTGVGIETVQDADGNMEVVEVVPGSPAEKAGLKKGDTITQIDGKDVARVTYSAAVNELEGAAGSQIKFKCLREQKAKDSSTAGVQSMNIIVTRGEYTRRTLESSMINGNVAYLKIIRFGANTADNFNTAVSDLVNKGACGLLIDLRGNANGSMSSAASVLDTLLPAGTTVQSRDKTGKITVEFTSKANEIGLPISVLVDNRTSGAAELFAADIRDYKKGMLIGAKTAGNGMKDTAVPLSDGSAMILPTAEYLTAGSTAFDGSGVTVDVTKDLEAAQQALLEKNSLAPDDDAQVQTAVTALVRQGARVAKNPANTKKAVSSASVKK